MKLQTITMGVLLLSALTANATQQTINSTDTVGVQRGKINTNFTDLYTLVDGSPWLAQTTAPNVHNVFWIDTSAATPIIKYWDGDSWEVAAAGGDGTYTLPAASVETLGGVKDGAGVTIAADGTISADDQLVGDCTAGPCLDGTSDGGNYIKLWAGTGSYWTALQGGSPAANRSWRLPIAAPPSAGSTYLMNMDEYGQMGFVVPSTFLTPTGSGAALTVDSSGFDGNLTTSDNTLQEVLQKVDDLIVGGNGYTNLTEFVGQTAWRIFYSDGSGDVKELSLGSNGEYLKSNGASLAPSWATPSGAVHDAVTLGTDADAILSLSTQQITLDSQLANTVFAAPNGSSGAPTFRALVEADIPSAVATDAEVSAGYQPLDADLTDLADGSLTGSKIGTGIDGGNISTGTVADARIDAAIARDTEVTAAINTLPNLMFGTGLTVSADTPSAGTDTISVTTNTYQAYDANMILWPSTISAAEVEYLNGLGGPLTTLLAAKLDDSQLDDTKGNGDTGYILSADKVFDLLALKRSTSDEREPIGWHIKDADVVTVVADGKQGAVIPVSLNGMVLVDFTCSVSDLNSAASGYTTVVLRRVRGATAVDMTSTAVTIAYNEYTASDEVVDTTNDDVATGDKIFVDVNSVTSPAQKGLGCTAVFANP